MSERTPKDRVTEFLANAEKVLEKLPWFKRGVLEASSRATNETPRKPVIGGSDERA